jgi:hypothetical protein
VDRHLASPWIGVLAQRPQRLTSAPSGEFQFGNALEPFLAAGQSRRMGSARSTHPAGFRRQDFDFLTGERVNKRLTAVNAADVAG